MTDNDRSSRGREDNRWLPAETVLYWVHPATTEPDQENGVCTVDAGEGDTAQDG